jgi:magnesium-transporting ATPase (P-type)
MEEKVFWRDITVGDILLIKQDEIVPADIIVLDTYLYQDHDNVCHIDTYLVDGFKNQRKKLVIFFFYQKFNKACVFTTYIFTIINNYLL